MTFFPQANGIGKTGIRFALITFASDATVDCDFNHVGSLSDFNACADGAGYNRGLTNTHGLVIPRVTLTQAHF